MAALLRPTAHRALHLQIHPRPMNIGESREVLRLISQFGEVEHFRNLKYDRPAAPNSALVIFKTEEGAERCSRAAPIRFTMGRDSGLSEGLGGGRRQGSDGVEWEELDSLKEEEDTAAAAAASAAAGESAVTAAPAAASRKAGPWGLGQARGMSTTTAKKAALEDPEPQQPTASPSESPYLSSFPSSSPQPSSSPRQHAMERHLLQHKDEQQDQQRVYLIRVNTARINFRDRVNEGHYHGRFPINTGRVSQRDLAQRVPLLGLSCLDWNAAAKPWRVMQREREQEYGGGRRQRQRNEEVGSKGDLQAESGRMVGRRKTLREMWREGSGSRDTAI